MGSPSTPNSQAIDLHARRPLTGRDVGNQRPQHRAEVEHLQGGPERLPTLEAIEHPRRASSSLATPRWLKFVGAACVVARECSTARPAATDSGAAPASGTPWTNAA